MMRSSLVRPFLPLLLLAGCVPLTRPDPTLSSSTAAYEQLQPPSLVAPSANLPGLSILEILSSTEPQLRLECQKTPMHLLFPEILNRAGWAYQLGHLMPNFLVTARLEKIPLASALTLLFEDSPYLPQSIQIGSERVWTIVDRLPRLDSDPGGATTKLVGLHHLPADVISASVLKNTAYPELRSARVDPASLAFHGPAEKLQGVAQAISELDVSPPTVQIRVRPFGSIQELIESYFPNPTGGLTGSAGPVVGAALPNYLNADPASTSLLSPLLAGRLSGLYSGTANNPSDLQGTISALVQRLKQDFYADTQLTVLSGKTCSLKVGRTGYILTPLYADGLVTNTSLPANATTELSITPTVLSNGEIRLSLNFSSYRFIPNELFGLIASVRGSQIESSVQVPPGQPVILAGRDSSQKTQKQIGWPWLRKIPGLGFLFEASESQVAQNLSLLVIWAELVQDMQAPAESAKTSWLMNPNMPFDRASLPASQARTGWDP